MYNKPMSRQALYSKVSSYTPEIIDRLLELSRSSNENVALGACKTLLSKSIPDLKALNAAGFENYQHVRNVIYLPIEKKCLINNGTTNLPDS
ncbi:MAG: hypothetical protein PVJ09_04085 [Candidatus Woesebacteria bacterium]